jgi:hypothetical protein
MSSAQTHRQSWPIVRDLCDIRRTPRARTKLSPFRAWRGRAPLKCRSSLNKRDFQLFKRFIRKNNLKRLACRIIIIILDINMTFTQGGVSREHYRTTTTQLSKASNCLLSNCPSQPRAAVAGKEGKQRYCQMLWTKKFQAADLLIPSS